jgi:ABC-type lipoprotein export system ATPase subunit
LFCFIKTRPASTKRKILTWKLGILEELDEGDVSLKVCSRKNYLSPKSLRRWRLQRVDFLATSATMMDATTRHKFLNMQTLYSGRKPKIDDDTLDKVLTMYHKLRDNDHIFTLNMFAAEVRPSLHKSQVRQCKPKNTG